MKNTLHIHMGERVITRRFPAKYAEFQRRHIVALASWLGAKRTLAAYPIFLIRFLQIPRKVWKRMDAEDLFWCEVEDDEVVLMPELAYLKTEYTNLRSLVKRLGVLIGPDDRMKNITLEQVAFADMFSGQYGEDPCAKNLNLFIAALYRPFFMPWHRRWIPLFARMAALVPRRVKLAALLNYRGLVRGSSALFPNTFGGKRTHSHVARLGWNGTIRKLAKTGMHGTEAQCRRMKYPDAMLTFEFGNLEVKDTEEAMKRARKNRPTK